MRGCALGGAERAVTSGLVGMDRTVPRCTRVVVSRVQSHRVRAATVDRSSAIGSAATEAR